MLIIYFIIAWAIGLIIGVIVMQKKNAHLKASYDSAQHELTTFKESNIRLTADIESLKDSLAQKNNDATILTTEHKNTQQQLHTLTQELSQYKQKTETVTDSLHKQENENATKITLIQSLEKENNRLMTELSENKANYQALEQKAEKEKNQLQQSTLAQKLELTELKKYIEETEKSTKEKLALLENAKETLTQQFENVANRIFEEKGEKFAKQNKFNLSEVLQPFTQEIGEFKKKIDDVYIKEAKERASLQTEVNKLFELNQAMSKETQNLTKALKGDKKLQGNWGEVVLERVLESSGLRKGHEYDTQLSLKGDDNQHLRPDVIVHLPDGKDVIIDAKVSLVSYEAYVRTEDDAQKSLYLKKHIDAIRQHISTLSEKSYEVLTGIHSLDFILMFMPIESAFVVAFQHDDSLFQSAFSQRIIIVTPTTLLATLGTIRNTWKYEKLNRNASEISERAAKMLDKFRGFTEDIEDLGRHIDKTQKSYDQALNKLTKGRGNLIHQSNQLKTLGVTMKKDFPQYISDQADG